MFWIPALLLSLQPVYVWGDLGHRTVAYPGEKYFTKDTSQPVNTLLANDPGADYQAMHLGNWSLEA